MTETLQDNRRAVVRVASTEVLKTLAAAARLFDGDMISLLVFTGVWVANVQHLTGADPNRYAAFKDIPPDSQRRAVTDEDLERLICIPQPILGQYIERLVTNGVLERMPSGLVAPSAIFTQPAQMASTNEMYARLLSLVAAIRAVGFSFGEDDAKA